MWIDFKLYFYVRIHKVIASTSARPSVVNWFQIVFLRENSQEDNLKSSAWSGCELISNCIFTWEFTRFSLFLILVILLWIDFKLYFYVRIHKSVPMKLLMKCVVNWFQIVFLRENSQAITFTVFLIICCELISNCIFTWEFTSIYVVSIRCFVLWIDFKLYFYVRIHKKRVWRKWYYWVVNWFQIVFLRENSQDLYKFLHHLLRCELISNCIFTWEFTRILLSVFNQGMLWIDFKLYFYVRIHKKLKIHN